MSSTISSFSNVAEFTFTYQLQHVNYLSYVIWKMLSVSITTQKFYLKRFNKYVIYSFLFIYVLTCSPNNNILGIVFIEHQNEVRWQLKLMEKRKIHLGEPPSFQILWIFQWKIVEIDLKIYCTCVGFLGKCLFGKLWNVIRASFILIKIKDHNRYKKKTLIKVKKEHTSV